MRRWTGFLIIALAACGAGDDTADGTRTLCAEGGALNDCNQTVVTPRDACWRMVDCGAIAVHYDDPNAFDWNRCVREIERMGDVEQQLVISCIAASTCDQLKANDGQYDDGPCFLLGAN